MAGGPFRRTGPPVALPSGLLGFAMSRVLLAEGAVLHQLNTIRSILFVFHVVVVALFALGASQTNLGTCGICHFGHLLP